ncbi:hypothetical protein Tco_0962622 [Tanacetum coccineum]
MKSVYLRNKKDKRRGVEYVMSKILGFYKERLELGPEYLTRMDDEGKSQGPPIFDDDQYEEESMPVYDTDIEDVIGGEEGFIEKGGFGRKEDNIEDVVSQLKSKSYDEIQKLFDKEMKRVNTFVDMNSEVVKGSETRTEESSKRAGDELEYDMSKKQKIDKHVEVKKDDQEEVEMKMNIKIVKDDEVAIDAYLATKAPSSDCLEYPE